MKMQASEERALERIRYWQGQILRSGDFRAELKTEAQLLAWHNRSLHRAFGVALGFDVSPVPAQGQITGVRVEPGVAYDCFGRPLILLASRTIPVPDQDTASLLTLVVKYRETSEFPRPGDAEGVCLTCCDSPADAETPDFVWTPSQSYSAREGVALAGLRYEHLKPRLLPTFVPMTTRPEAKPYLANGSTIPGNTPWAPWDLTANQQRLGIQTLVDTSAAGFTRTPCYFAWIEGLDSAFGQTDFVPVLFTHVENPTPTRFLFRLLIARPDQEIILLALRAQRRLRNPAYVCWLGCQSAVDTDQCLQPAAQKPCCS